MNARNTTNGVGEVGPRGIIVTGLIRSGTTWVGRVLATTKKTFYYHEPFNVNSHWNAAFPVATNYAYLENETSLGLRHRFNKLLQLEPVFLGEWLDELKKKKYREIESRKARHQSDELLPIIKDPVALFSLEWLVKSFSMRPVIVIRHPISVVKSLLKNNWVPDNFGPFNVQPRLCERFFSEEETLRIKEVQKGLYSQDRVGLACFYVRLMLHAVTLFHQEHPNWVCVEYEKFTQNPEQEFRRLFKWLELESSAYTENNVFGGQQGIYNTGLAHQETLAPIRVDQTRIFSEGEIGVNWKAMFDEYFLDIAESLNDVVSWRRA